MESRRADIPYRNLVLVGHLGAGKSATGRAVARRLGVTVVDIEAEIEAREGRPMQEIRALFGQARARTLETELCRELVLRRSAVIVASGEVALNAANLSTLTANADALCLLCALDEVLRRTHVAMGARFHEPRERARIIARLKREWSLRALPGIPQLDTTGLSIEQVADRAIAYWRRGVEGLRPPSRPSALEEARS